MESTDTLLAYNYAYETFKIPNYYNKNLEKSLTGVIPYNAPITYKQVELNRLDEVQRQDHLINSDLIHKLNLGDLGVDFQSISDELLDNPNTLDNINVLIFGSHNELPYTLLDLFYFFFHLLKNEFYQHLLFF